MKVGDIALSALLGERVTAKPPPYCSYGPVRREGVYASGSKYQDFYLVVAAWRL